MRIHVELDSQGMLPDSYGKYCSPHDQRGHFCGRSFPFRVDEIPSETAALAWVLLDWDSVAVCGFPWIHWCAQLALEPGTTSVEVPEDASRLGLPGFVQGYTSAAKSEPEAASGYVGPCPPDRDHVYTLRVVALSEACALSEPFWANQLVGSAREHALAEAVVQLPSRS